MTTQDTKQKIHRQMTIDSILALFPHKAQKLTQELTNAGLHCVGCHASTWETLEGGMYGHGKTDTEIEDLVKRLNDLLGEDISSSSSDEEEGEEEGATSTEITLTPRAAAKYLKILEEEGKQGWGLRFGERIAGCSGFEYILEHSENAKEDDIVFVSQGIEIHVKKTSLPRLKGSEIDYMEGLQGSGFKISNPNVRSACGCGTSHGY